MKKIKFLKILEKNLGFLPKTVHKAFEGIEVNMKMPLEESRSVYLNALLKALKKRSKNKMERYYVLAQLVFSYINFLYETLERVDIKQKFKFALGKENYLTSNINNLFLDSLEILLQNKPKKYKIESVYTDEILKYYDELISELVQKYLVIEKLLFTKEHFKRKIKEKKHPLFSRHVLKTYGLAFGKIDHIAPIIVTLESVVHGIDDYVDTQNQSYEKSFSDLANIVIGLFGIVLSLSSKQQKDFSDNLISFFNKKTKTERVLEAFKEALIDLTWTPFVERDTIKILEAKTEKEEYELAMKNLEKRTKGTTKTFTEPISILLGVNKNDAKSIAELVWMLRIMQMFYKDILDIKSDLKNKDYKAPSVWSIKYKGDEFKKRIKCLLEIYYSRSFENGKKLKKKYPLATEFLLEEIKNLREKIEEIINSSN